MSLKICFESQWCFVVLSHLNSLFIYIFHKLTKFFFFLLKDGSGFNYNVWSCLGISFNFNIFNKDVLKDGYQ